MESDCGRGDSIFAEFGLTPDDAGWLEVMCVCVRLCVCVSEREGGEGAERERLRFDKFPGE